MIFNEEFYYEGDLYYVVGNYRHTPATYYDPPETDVSFDIIEDVTDKEDVINCIELANDSSFVSAVCAKILL